ncbi:LytR/AlgR family response regulator transcription factor [Thalassotalea sp. PS06]|uniref:LytR/AlgR family response regulator transcription factor n=1 Tax=Thalassotalea sp. PS06 TaxID=2594005 RepID=UPI00116596B0|nr:response regulator [Thalassotalea sp. PS06]QDP01373.1 response regulator [Thalassotalea sp. PS06]
MSKLSTLIVDDEPLARKGLAVRLAGFDNIDIIGQCASGKDAIETIKTKAPDLVFLDIQMPEVSGFDVVRQLLNDSVDMPIVVFVTAFDHYAVQAFDIHALDYLLKPVDHERLSQTIDRVEAYVLQQKADFHKQRLIEVVSAVTGNDSQAIIDQLEDDKPVSTSSYSDVLAIKDVGETTLVPTKDIIWIDAAGDYMCVHTMEKTHILRKTMKELELLLDPRVFIRTHRSAMVNKRYIDKFGNQVNGEYYLILTNSKELKVSRSYKDRVKQAVLN